MTAPKDSPAPIEIVSDAIFLHSWPAYDRPSSIVTLGHYYPQRQIDVSETLLRESRSSYNAAVPIDPSAMCQNLGWTKLINALNTSRQWPIKRLFERLDPMLQRDISIAVVPTHMAYQAFWPTRTLARQLAADKRVDATSCLVRHTTIKRITFGGPSTRALHRQTVRLEHPELVAGRRVLLLDDITKSGASLAACREILLEEGATVVQSMALGRVIVDGMEPW
jgi:hypothetical protein